MPITLDIRDHPIFGPPLRKAERKVRREGRAEGELAILRRQLQKRFGPIPKRVEQRLARKSTAELEDLSVRLLDAKSLEELLR